jgi:hypothetical protein
MKISILLLSILLSAPAWPLEVTIARKNHLGFKKIDTLEVQNKTYYFNGQNLGESPPPKVVQSWKSVESLNMSQQDSKFCKSGFYNFEKKLPGKTEKWSGCSKGLGYGNLVKSLENIRQFARSK